jgi:Flp pilus assembly protein TadG
MTGRIPARIGTDRRAVSAVEFALLAPVMLTLICGAIDLGYLYMAQSSLMGAVSKAARESAATQESSQDARDAAMRATITATMRPYLLVPGQQPSIVTVVYQSFGDSRPEDYTDVNGNGQYDVALPPAAAEPFVDHNGNGQWDPALPIADSKTGAEGDVVSYTATYPVQHLFDFLTRLVFREPGISLKATSVVRNEPVKTT